LGEKQLDWKSKAKLNDHRVALAMPIKLRKLRSLMEMLVPHPAVSAVTPSIQATPSTPTG
jgi:hypothetical protein